VIEVEVTIEPPPMRGIAISVTSDADMRSAFGHIVWDSVTSAADGAPVPRSRSETRGEPPQCQEFREGIAFERRRTCCCSEAYFVLGGTVSVVVDGDELLLGPEDFVLVPHRRLPHLRQRRRRGGAPPGAARPALMAQFGMVTGDE